MGINLAVVLTDLYRTERIVATEVDGYTAATIRSSKIISAIRDGLNRGVYSYLTLGAFERKNDPIKFKVMDWPPRAGGAENRSRQAT